MKSTLLFLLPTALAVFLVGCGAEGKLPDTSAPPPISTSTLVQPTLPGAASAAAPVDPSATTASMPIELSALCSFDPNVPEITCHASGATQGSQLRWESNISGWDTGTSYEIVLNQEYQLVPEVVVALEACQNSTCERVEFSVDTSALVAAEDNKTLPPVLSATAPTATPPTTTPRATGEGTESVMTDPIPVAIESLTCDDNQITALYPTTCRAELSGQVDWVNWEFEKGDRGWNRDVEAENALEGVLVQEEVTRRSIGDYEIPFKACTGGGDWYPGAECVEKTVTIQVVAGARWANGLPCESDTNPSFKRWLMDQGQTKEIWGTGVATHSGTSQHSYTYPRYELEPNGVAVYAPVDSYLWQAETRLTYSNGVKDYRLVFMVSCEVWMIFGHVVNPDQRIVDLVSSIADENGHGLWSAKPPLKYVNEQIDPIFFEAGEVLFRHLPNRPGTNQGFDYGVYDGTYINEYLNPARWEKTDTFLHALCPWAYQAEPARSEVMGLLLPYQSTGAICPGVNREVVGTLAGMWHFADPTAPVIKGHTLRFGGDLTFVEYFDGLIHVGGLNSKDIGGLGGQAPNEEFILRLGPGQATYRLPQEVTTSHCYEGYNLVEAGHPNNFGYMFLYVEIVDDMTIHVALADGTCPASLPAEYVTYVR
jgi:hypothetical protein